jgi:hypothetical protein
MKQIALALAAIVLTTTAQAATTESILPPGMRSITVTLTKDKPDLRADPWARGYVPPVRKPPRKSQVERCRGPQTCMTGRGETIRGVFRRWPKGDRRR